MLPFTKRAPRQAQRPAESSEVISTGEIEIVRTPGGSMRPAAQLPRVMAPPGGDRPRVFQRAVANSGADDEDRTLLMSSKTRSAPAPAHKSAPPAPMTSMQPPSVKPPPPPSLKGLVRPRHDEERTILRPMAPVQAALTQAAAHKHAAAKPAVSPAMMPTPYMPFKPGMLPQPPKPAAVTGAKDGSDPRIDVPAAVITTRTRILRAKPTISWAAALMALGVFTGLVTAVVARGDADSLLDATASLVDPSNKHATASAGAAAAVAAPVPAQALPAAANAAAACTDTPMAAPVGVSVANNNNAPAAHAPDAPKAAPVAAPIAINSMRPAEAAPAKPEPPKPPPVAFAAPAQRAQSAAAAPALPPAPKPMAPPQMARPSAPPPAAVAVAKPAPAPRAAAPEKAEKSPKTEMESATAADALAKAQLEASLR